MTKDEKKRAKRIKQAVKAQKAAEIRQSLIGALQGRIKTALVRGTNEDPSQDHNTRNTQ